LQNPPKFLHEKAKALDVKTENLIITNCILKESQPSDIHCSSDKYDNFFNTQDGFNDLWC